jgi:hypothetical protein
MREKRYNGRIKETTMVLLINKTKPVNHLQSTTKMTEI